MEIKDNSSTLGLMALYLAVTKILCTLIVCFTISTLPQSSNLIPTSAGGG